MIDSLWISCLGQDGQKIVRARRIVFDNGLHHRLHLYFDALLGLASDIDQQVSGDVCLAHVCKVDKCKTSGTEAEDKDVAGKLQLVLHVVQSPTIPVFA